MRQLSTMVCSPEKPSISGSAVTSTEIRRSRSRSPTASDRSSIVSGSSAVIAYSFLYSAPYIETVPLPDSTVNVPEKVTCVAIDVRSTSVEYWPSELAYVRVQVLSPPPLPHSGTPSPDPRLRAGDPGGRGTGGRPRSDPRQPAGAQGPGAADPAAARHTPGAVIGPGEVQWCRDHGRSVDIEHLSTGAHFLPEDLSPQIADAVVAWGG